MSILRKTSPPAMQNQRASGRIVLSDLAVSIRYEGETLTLHPTKFDPAERQSTNNETNQYSNASDAIDANRRKAERRFNKRLIDIEKELASRRMLHCSLDDMERIQTNLIDELDALREVDPVTGDLLESQEYIDLEYRLQFMLDACECLIQKKHAETLFGPAPDEVNIRPNSRRRRSNDNVDKQNKKIHPNASCFSGVYKKLFSDAKCVE